MTEDGIYTDGWWWFVRHIEDGGIDWNDYKKVSDLYGRLKIGGA